MHIDSFEVIFFACLIPSIILHEIAHGWVALMFGDDTAKKAGRLTLNPLPHIDLFGTIILPAILVLIGAPAFGWAKPVPVDVSKLRKPRDQWVVVALAGPSVNIALATLAAIGFHLLDTPSMPVVVLRVLYYLGLANILLAVFNLLPIPPLDGSAVLERALPERWLPGYYRIRMALILVPLALFLLVPPVRDWFFNTEINLWDKVVGLG
ncbi:MAG: site-2 protease family protein [Actinobacteria bacterium]|nr:site-2 protease family protein [Actinomycetota bacterium]